MKSWSNWQGLSKENVKNIPENVKGVYVIRKTTNVKKGESDIIYIGVAGVGDKQGINTRMRKLLRGLESKNIETAKKLHCVAPKMQKYKKDDLEFSWIECFKFPDGVEKAILLAFCVSATELPVCNGKF